MRFFEAVNDYDTVMEPLIKEAIKALHDQTISDLISKLPGLQMEPDVTSHLAMDNKMTRFYERNRLTHKGRDFHLGFYTVDSVEVWKINVLPLP